jgi:hypothetical protein
VAQESPLGCAEEGVRFHVGRTSAAAEAAEFVLDEEFTNEGFAETAGGPVSVFRNLRLVQTYVETCGAPEPSGNGTSSLKMFAKVAFLFFPLNGVVP